MERICRLRARSRQRPFPPRTRGQRHLPGADAELRVEAAKRGRAEQLALWAAAVLGAGFPPSRRRGWSRAEGTGACANPGLEFGRMSRAEGQRAKAVEDAGKGMAVMMSCVVWRPGDGEPGGAGPRGKVQGARSRMRSAGVGVWRAGAGAGSVGSCGQAVGSWSALGAVQVMTRPGAWAAGGDWR